MHNNSAAHHQPLSYTLNHRKESFAWKYINRFTPNLLETLLICYVAIDQMHRVHTAMKKGKQYLWNKVEQISKSNTCTCPLRLLYASVKWLPN